MAEEESELTDEQVLTRMAQAMKDNPPALDEKQTVHTFLLSVVTAPDSRKIGNLRDDKDLNELGFPRRNVRGSFELARISRKLMNNEFFATYFEEEAENILATSLSREGFLVRQATTQVKKVADITKRRKVNRGWFGKKSTESSGGDTPGDNANEQ
jgi:hypothetical protein